MKKILMLMILLNSPVFSCPHKDIHDDMQIINKWKWVKITNKQLIVYEKKINEVCIKKSKKEGYSLEKYYWSFWHTFRYYAKHHKLEVVYRK